MTRPTLVCCLAALAAASGRSALGEEENPPEAIFEKMVAADGDEYVKLRKKLLSTEGARAALESNVKEPRSWKHKALARGALAWLDHEEEIKALLTDESILRSLQSVWHYTRYNWCPDAAVMRQVGKKIDDETFLDFILERLLKAYRTEEWATALRKLAKGANSAEYRERLEANVGREAEQWQIVAARSLSQIGTPETVRPLTATALQATEATVRVEAIQALSVLKDRRAVPTTPETGPDGKLLPGGGGRTHIHFAGHRPLYRWEEEKVVFTDSHRALIRHALLLALVLDPSPDVQKRAASALRCRRELEALPLLRNAVQLIDDGEVRKAAQEAIESFEAIQDR